MIKEAFVIKHKDKNKFGQQFSKAVSIACKD
jgi:hypothetical protein